MTRLEFGLAIDFGSEAEPLAARVERLVPLLREAERYGFRSVSAGELYPTQPGYFHQPSPLLILAALAPRTSLHLGTGATLLPAWDPLRLAYEVSVLDQLSSGRVFLGAAAGNPLVWSRFGIAPERLGDRLDQTVRALKALWSGADGFAGDLVHIEGGIRPLPAQAGGPPIWLGGDVPRAARRAALLADGWFAGTYARLDSGIRSQAARYRAAAGADSPSRAGVAANRLTVVAEEDAAARRDGQDYVEGVLQTYAGFGVLRDDGGDRLRPGKPLAQRLDEQLLLVGSPETVNRRLERYVEAGVTQIQARVWPSDMPIELVLRTIRLMGEHVLPRWRGREAPGA